jgi:signal transduction histidine kinase
MLLPHAYIFSLSAVFIYFVDSWYDKPRYWKSIIIGLISGIIVLVRPNNITILMLLVLWGIQSLSDFTFRINFGVKKWKHFLIMAIFFIIIWIPQFYYWYTITDKIFYFSYNIIGGVFYFNNPQILNQLISFRSGALNVFTSSYFRLPGSVSTKEKQILKQNCINNIFAY